MKKMNNKGFAITTVIYGLSIMGIMLIAIIMATISTNRRNNRSIASVISKDLNTFSNNEVAFDATPGVGIGQEYKVTEGEAGWYKIELWGAQGGGPNGGLGAYTSGIIELKEGDKLYFYVGKHKESGLGGEESDVRVVNGDYDDPNSYSTRIMVAAGGGADEGANGGTLLAYDKELTPYDGIYDPNYGYIMNGNMNKVSDQNGETVPITTNKSLFGYKKGINSYLNKVNVNSNDELPAYYRMFPEPVPSLLVPSYNLANRNPALRSPKSALNGGDGYLSSVNMYGLPKVGGSSFGGVSYIAGFPGTIPTRRLGLEQYWNITDISNGIYDPDLAFEYDGLSFSSEFQQYQNGGYAKRTYFFYDGMMFPGVNKGDGKAKITKFLPKTHSGQFLTRNNKALENVEQVEVCFDEKVSSEEDNGMSTSPPYQIDYEQILSNIDKNVSIIFSGLNYASIFINNRDICRDPNRDTSAPGCSDANVFEFNNPTSGNKRICSVFKMQEMLKDSTSGIDMISINFDSPEHRYIGLDILNLEIKVKHWPLPGQSEGVEESIISPASFNEVSEIGASEQTYSPNISMTMGSTGLIFSGYQFDSSKGVRETGNYFIQPVLSENKVLTAPVGKDRSNNPVKFDYMGGYKNQLWEISYSGIKDANGHMLYKIVNSASNNALSIKDDENKLNNYVVADRPFNDIAAHKDYSQLWRVTPVHNGTFIIETAVPSHDTDPYKETGYLYPQTNPYRDNYGNIIIGNKFTREDVTKILAGESELRQNTNVVVGRFKLISADYSTSGSNQLS